MLKSYAERGRHETTRANKAAPMMTALRTVSFWLSSLAVATALLYGLFPQMDERAFEDAALGDQTKTVIGTFQGDRVHCFTMDNGDECLRPALARGLPRQVLWLGNSQLHSINQLREGDKLASVQLARALRQSDTEFLTFSQPNANLQEHLVLFETLTGRLTLDLLILPVFFDDTREGGVRPDILTSLHDPQVATRLTNSDIGHSILELLASKESVQNGRATLQDQSEAAITATLEQAIGWESLRARARGTISLTVYKTRNAVFGITPNSVRRKIPATYAANMDALEQILSSAMARGIAVLTYVPPLRSDVTRPYEPEEYDAFKAEVEAIANRYGMAFANLEEIVAGPLWGTKPSTGIGDTPEYDFMHFQGRGHDLLADALLRILSRMYHDL